jgi:hypothetical protein
MRLHPKRIDNLSQEILLSRRDLRTTKAEKTALTGSSRNPLSDLVDKPFIRRRVLGCCFPEDGRGLLTAR